MEDNLLKSDLFKGLSANQYNRVIACGYHQLLRPKSVLFHQGDRAINFYIVNKGRLKLSKLNEQGGEVIVRFINTGELTAAVSSLKERNYPVTAEAVGNTEVIGWDKTTIVELINEYPEIAISLLNIVLERIDDIQHRYLELSTERVEQRIARSLLRLMRSSGKKTADGILIDFPVTRQDIASFSGTTLFTVSRTLSTWGKKGWVKSGRERIIITDPHTLVLFSENA